MNSHSHPPGTQNALHNISRALVLNFIFVIIELVGAYFSGSVAIYADAIHDAGDSLTLIIAWFLQRASHKKRTKDFSYGYSRLSLASSLVVGGVLIGSSLLITWHAINNFNAASVLRPQIMLPVALLGVFFNGWAFSSLRHGHSHNEQAISLHMLEDLLGWVAVLVTAVVLIFFPLYWLDPLLAIGIAIFTLYNAIRNISESARVFLQAQPKGFDQESYFEKVRNLPGVTSTHDVHVWSLDGHHHVISYHLQVDPKFSQDQIANVKESCRSLLKSFGHFHSTIETEVANAPCAANCDPEKT
jgi:cobalt-zinc-cadmium efflux system protein